jgi:2-keto-3-deoxy-L-arabinonate dehydratase
MGIDPGQVRGVYPILYAFFDEQGKLDRDLMRRQALSCVKHNPHGIAALGLATEVTKLSTAERRQVMEWLVEDVDGACPIAITIAEPTVQGQADFAKAADALGVDFVILQPPPVGGLAEAEYVRFFGSVAEKVSIPVAIQNAAAYIGVGLSVDGLKTLNRNHPNVALLKGEGPAIEIAGLVDATDGVFRVLNGRGGLEFPDNLRGGCVGMIPAPDCFDRQIDLYKAFEDGRIEDMEAIYRDILPVIIFCMQSVQNFLCYGKRITALRMGLSLDQVHDRAPAQQPTPHGLEWLKRYADELGAF